jgi:hypothetical protein
MREDGSTMRIRRGLLFSGLFLIPVGGLTLLVRGGYLDPSALADAWRLWPLVLVGLGIAILLGRTSFAVLGTAISGLALGLIVGGGLASGSWVGFGVCADPNADVQQLDQAGTFDGAATVSLDLRCGSADLATEAGAGWHVQAGYASAAPAIGASSTRLSLRAPEGSDVRQVWTVKVAPDRLSELEVRVNGANATAQLDGASLARVSVDANASDVLVTAGTATMARLNVTANAGRIRITLGPGPTVGDLQLNASAMDLCVPGDAGLRITANEQLTFATNLGERGLTHTGTVWERPATGSGGLIDLTISGNASAFNLDPSGGCA